MSKRASEQVPERVTWLRVWVTAWANETAFAWVCVWERETEWFIIIDGVFSLSVTVSVAAMCLMLSGSQRSAIQYNGACCCSGWPNSVRSCSAHSSQPDCTPQRSLFTCLLVPERCSAFSPPRDLCHGWQGEEGGWRWGGCSQGRASFHYLTQGICFISALFDMQSGLVRCQTAKLCYSSSGWTRHNFTPFLFLPFLSPAAMILWPIIKLQCALFNIQYVHSF